jgi:hypothetical protein
MRISVDSEDIFELSEIQKKVIKNDIHADEFDKDMKRRLHWILNHKYERCFERLKTEWLPKLKIRMSSIPTDDDQLASIIFSQPDYKCRKTRDAEKEKRSVDEILFREAIIGNSEADKVDISFEKALDVHRNRLKESCANKINQLNEQLEIALENDNFTEATAIRHTKKILRSLNETMNLTHCKTIEDIKYSIPIELHDVWNYYDPVKK